MKMLMNATIIVEQVGKWGKQNFEGRENPWLGMVEEVGEISHCLLKQQQGIRGFQDDKFFYDQLKDSLGDFGIYAAHYAYIYDMMLYLGYEEPFFSLKEDNNKIVNEVLYRLTLLHDCDKEQARQMQYSLAVRAVKTLALKYKIDFHVAVTETWHTIVAKRNWVIDPTTGMAQHDTTSDSGNSGRTQTDTDLAPGDTPRTHGSEGELNI